MTPHYTDAWLTIYGGDCRTVLAELPDASVHCVVTSPPYWGLRDYGTATWSGGDPDCDHEPDRSSPSSTLEGGKASQGQGRVVRGRCPRCGATRVDEQLGLEATPQAYVDDLVAIFRELRRVLRDDGTVWLNLGDSYSHSGRGAGGDGIHSSKQVTNRGAYFDSHDLDRRADTDWGLGPKQLVGIPWRVAFALQADGWYLRSDVIWAKPNPMPESVTDRPTKSHEYVFLLAKSERYYYDQDAVAEVSVGGHASGVVERSDNHQPDGPARFGTNVPWPPLRPSQPRGSFNGKTEAMPGRNAFRASTPMRSLRSVWTIATHPYPGAHFAVFPRELPTRCIKASTSERGVCPECGTPWHRLVERESVVAAPRGTQPSQYRANLAGPQQGSITASSTTTGWQAGCDCDARAFEANRPYPAPVPATVLDPFAGSGTTGMVAQSLSRRAVLIDLNPAYLEQQLERNAQMPLGLGAP